MSADKGSISKGSAGGAGRSLTVEAGLCYWWHPKQSNPSFRALKPSKIKEPSLGVRAGTRDMQPLPPHMLHKVLWSHVTPSIHLGPQIDHRLPHLGKSPDARPPDPPALLPTKGDPAKHLWAALLCSKGQWGLTGAFTITWGSKMTLQRRKEKQELHTKCEF